MWSSSCCIAASTVAAVLWSLIVAAAIVVADGDEQLDGASVIANLENYDKLYVSYSNCAWSVYDNGEDNACGAEGEEDGGEDEENEYWYMGLTECFRANAAYSLYGIKSGDTDNGCRKATFINSFFTVAGVEYFIESMGNAGVNFSNGNNNNNDGDGDGDEEEENDEENEITSDCEREENGDGEGDEEEGNNNNNNRQSTGLACDSNKRGTFVQKTFQGAYCDARSNAQTTNELTSFNEDMESISCIAIYDSSSGNNYNKNNDNEDENNNNSPLNLLSYSAPCDVRMFPGQCPDPYKKLTAAALTASKGLSMTTHPVGTVLRNIFSWILLGLGGLFGIASCLACYRKRQVTEAIRVQEQRKKRGKFRNLFKRSSKNKKTSSNDDEN